jgi:predicted HNH restriction endonuclease
MTGSKRQCFWKNTTFNGNAYASKAIVGVGHKYSGDGWPVIHTSDGLLGGPTSAVKRLEQLGFTVTHGDGDHQKQVQAYVDVYHEGEQQIRETKYFARNPGLVRKAKAHFGAGCQACGSNFEAVYGPLGIGYIECHHLNPLAQQDGSAHDATVDNVRVLCSNCHRMIHRLINQRSGAAVSIEEFREIIETAKRLYKASGAAAHGR